MNKTVENNFADGVDGCQTRANGLLFLHTGNLPAPQFVPVEPVMWGSDLRVLGQSYRAARGEFGLDSFPSKA
jgi:hypothetical protein